MTKKVSRKQFKAVQKASTKAKTEITPEIAEGYIKASPKDFFRLLSFAASSNIYYTVASQEDRGADNAATAGRLYSNMKVIGKVVEGLQNPVEKSLLVTMADESDYLVTRFKHLLNEDAQAELTAESQELARLIEEALAEQVADEEVSAQQLKGTTESNLKALPSLTKEEAEVAADSLKEDILGGV